MRNAEVDERIARWCSTRRSRSGSGPVVIGINGPQGSGKSTLASLLVRRLGELGKRAAALSIDDFYLTHAEQRALAAQHPSNRALEYRGYPGTHDLALGTETLDSLRAGRPTAVPRYDKSAHQGRGDRMEREAWPMVTEPLDVILFEGWLLGFKPIAPSVLPAELIAPNTMLARYEAWHERLDAFIVMRAATLDDIVRWRVGAERVRRESGQASLTDDEARDYIERFLPAYRAWAPTLEADLTLTLNSDRTFIAFSEAGAE